MQSHNHLVLTSLQSRKSQVMFGVNAAPRISFRIGDRAVVGMMG